MTLFTSDVDPQKHNSAVCRHCKETVTYSHKTEQVIRHLNKIKLVFIMVNMFLLMKTSSINAWGVFFFASFWERERERRERERKDRISYVVVFSWTLSLERPRRVLFVVSSELPHRNGKEQAVWFLGVHVPAGPLGTIWVSQKIFLPRLSSTLLFRVGACLRHVRGFERVVTVFFNFYFILPLIGRWFFFPLDSPHFLKKPWFFQFKKN